MGRGRPWTVAVDDAIRATHGEGSDRCEGLTAVDGRGVTRAVRMG